MTRSPALVFPPMPCRKSPTPCPLPNSGPDRRGLHWETAHDPLSLCRHGPPRRPGRHKIPDVVQLATPGKRPVQAMCGPCNSGIVRHLFRGDTRKPTQADNIVRWQMIPPKNKPLRKPLEPPHGKGIKKPATMGGIGGTAAGWIWAKGKPPENPGACAYLLFFRISAKTISGKNRIKSSATATPPYTSPRRAAANIAILQSLRVRYFPKYNKGLYLWVFLSMTTHQERPSIAVLLAGTKFE